MSGRRDYGFTLEQIDGSLLLAETEENADRIRELRRIVKRAVSSFSTVRAAAALDLVADELVDHCNPDGGPCSCRLCDAAGSPLPEEEDGLFGGVR